MARKQFKNVSKAAMKLFRRESAMSVLGRHPWATFGAVLGASLGAVGASLLMSERFRRAADEAIRAGWERVSATLESARRDATQAVRSVAPRNAESERAATH